MMKQKKVKFASADEAKEFVRIANGCDFDVNVFYNRMIIDAKSLLGVLSLDLTKILTVEFDGENAPFEDFLDKKIRCMLWHKHRNEREGQRLYESYSRLSFF